MHVCMYDYVCTYIYVYGHTVVFHTAKTHTMHAYVYTRTHLDRHIHVYTCTCRYIYICVHIWICLSVCVYVGLYAFICLFKCLQAYMCTKCIYMYEHKQRCETTCIIEYPGPPSRPALYQRKRNPKPFQSHGIIQYSNSIV